MAHKPVREYRFRVSDSSGPWGIIRQRDTTAAKAKAKCLKWLRDEANGYGLDLKTVRVVRAEAVD